MDSITIEHLFKLNINRSSYKHEKKELYLYYNKRPEGSRWLIDNGKWYNNVTKRNEGKNSGAVWAETTSNVPSTGLKWRKGKNIEIPVKVQCTDRGNSVTKFR